MLTAHSIYKAELTIHLPSCNNGKNNPILLLFSCVQHLACNITKVGKREGKRNLSHKVAQFY